MLRRLHLDQPKSFTFTKENLAWAKAQIKKYPNGRQQSAVIPILWRAQEQESWLSRPAIEYVADMLGMSYMRVLEVATFYFMFQLAPVGRVAHFQVCGTTPCMLRGSETLVDICKRRISQEPHALSSDGKFSWEEVECLGACSNAPVTQVGKDYYEDLTPETFEALIDTLEAGNLPVPGPQNGRIAAEPLGENVALRGTRVHPQSATTEMAQKLGDGIARIKGPGPVADMPNLVDLRETAPVQEN